MITRVTLENWKNFRKVDVELADRMFLVGPNASGKSNLLDAFRFLCDIAKVGGGLQKAVNDRGGVSKLRCLAARKYTDITVEVTLELNETWRYRIRFNQDNNRNPILKEEKIWKGDTLLRERPTEEDKDDPARMTQTELEQINANKDFREIAQYLAGVKYLHIVPQLVREPERSVGRHGDAYGGDFLEQIARVPSRTRDSRLSFIKDALKVAVPQLKELELYRDERGTPHLRGLYEHWRPKAGWQTEEQFSDGTLRLMGLLWSLLDGTGLLLLEEPELSLHPEVVRYIPQMIARSQRRRPRQVLISTHSRDILEDEDISADEVLMLVPSPEGTRVLAGKDDEMIHELLEGGATIADAVIPRTKPQDASKLSGFGEKVR
ncbi:AAA family ATPase [Symbiobacterium thermophilum]|uniref:AAA family ATPase n=1 Tax=Symbiobacterium thermophilum TaxID=2734 RepID=UPI0009FF10C4|nr:ATP-binding protein [Symbiobacterium thermophilum]